MNFKRENYNITFKNTFNNDNNSNKNNKKINNSFDNSITSSKYFFDNINYNFNESKKYIDFSLKKGAKLNDKNLMKFVNKKKNIINKIPIITEQISKNKFIFYNYNKSKKNIKNNNINNLNIEDKKRRNINNFKKNNYKNNTNISSKKSSNENSSYDSKNINFNNYNINKNLFEIKLFPYNNNNINNINNYNNNKNIKKHNNHSKQKNSFDNSSHNSFSLTIEYKNTNNNYNNNIENKIIYQDDSFIQISNFLNNFIDIKFHINFLCMPRVVNLLNINIRIIFMMTKSSFYLKYNIENYDIKWLNSNNRTIINSFNIINVVYCDFKEKIIDNIKVINIIINKNDKNINNNNNFDILCNNNNEAKLFVNSINIVCNYCKCKCYKYKENIFFK